MTKTETVAAPSVVKSEPAPPAPNLELLELLSATIARTESGLAKWAGGNTQFEATRFKLGGQLEALQAMRAALEGDAKLLRDL